MEFIIGAFSTASNVWEELASSTDDKPSKVMCVNNSLPRSYYSIEFTPWSERELAFIGHYEY